MTRLKFDVTGVDPGGDFKVPKPGAYSCKIDVIEPKKSQADNDMLEVQYVITEDGEFEGSRLWDYIVLNDSSAWKYRRFLEAVGAVSGKKEKGEINLERLIGKRVLVKVTNEDSDEWGKRARVGSVSKLSKADVDEDEPEDEDEDVEDDDEGDEEELTLEDVMSMKKVELKELIADEELGLRVTKQTKLNKLRERVAEALGLEDEEDEDDEDIEDEDVEEEDSADEEDADEDDDEEDDEDDDEVEEVEDYAELSVGDLKAECKERGLSIKGTKAALVKRLEKDDDEADAL